MEFLRRILLTVDYLAIVYFVIVYGIYLLLNSAAFFSIRRSGFYDRISEKETNFHSEFYKPLSIIVPAYNEEKTVVENVNSMLALDYPEFEIIVVNDGSNDDTLARLKEKFSLVSTVRPDEERLETEKVRKIYRSPQEPGLVVIDKKNGGKADALNAGINMAQFPLICSVDADSLLDSSALIKIVEPFVRDWRVVAAGGTVRIANDSEIKNGGIKNVRLPRKSLPRFQVVEYLRAFLFGRMGWAALRSLLIISGAFGVFKRKFVIEAGGYTTDTVGEDMELVLKLHQHMVERGREFRFKFIPEPVCWTQVPESISMLASQRRRWQRGLGESLILHKNMLFNKKFGPAGMLAYPFFLLVEFLGPVLELAGYMAIILTIILGFASTELILLFILAAVGLGVLLSTLSLLYEELSFGKYPGLKDILILFAYAVLENFGYRQLHSWWRLRGIIDFLRKRTDWGEQLRRDF